MIFLTLIWCYLRHPGLIVQFLRRAGYWPNPARPARIHEKYLWRKIFDHDPLHTMACDKLAAKRFVAETFPQVCVPESLWIGDDPSDIPANLLTGEVVIKANHGCGWNWFVHQGDVDRPAMEAAARRWLASRYGRNKGEWGYRNVTPRLFVEPMLMQKGRMVDIEYKCYVSGGEFIYAYVKVGRYTAAERDVVLGPDGRYHEVELDLGTVSGPLERPKLWGRIVEAAEALGRPFDFVRCDLYELDGEIWFSEYTLYSSSGFAWCAWHQGMDRMNRLWDLRNSWFLSRRQPGWRGAYAQALHRALAANE